MVSQPRLRIASIGGCAIIVGLIVMWILRPAAQIDFPVGRWFALIWLALGIILILYGVQSTSRRSVRLIRAVAIYLLFGILFWIILIGYYAARAGSPTALFKLIEGLVNVPWLLAWGIICWPTMTIQALGIFGYWFFD